MSYGFPIEKREKVKAQLGLQKISEMHLFSTCIFQNTMLTFLNHLFRYLQEGNGLIKSDELMALSTVSSEQKDHVLDKFEDLGTEFLKPVFDALGGEIDYEELKIIRLYYLGKKGVT